MSSGIVTVVVSICPLSDLSSFPRQWEHLKGWASSRKDKTEAAVKFLMFHIHLVPPWKSPAGPSHLHTPGGLELCEQKGLEVT